MCEELEEELERGREAVRELVRHIEAMGAKKMSIPATTDDGCYLIKVIKTL